MQINYKNCKNLGKNEIKELLVKVKGSFVLEDISSIKIPINIIQVDGNKELEASINNFIINGQPDKAAEEIEKNKNRVEILILC